MLLHSSHDAFTDKGISHPQAFSKRSLALTAAVNGSALTAAVSALGSNALAVAESALAVGGLADEVSGLAESALAASG